MPASVLSSAPRSPCAPNPQYVEQLGDYLTQSVRQGKLRMGVLTNGKHWVLGRPGAGEVRMDAAHHPLQNQEPSHITFDLAV